VANIANVVYNPLVARATGDETTPTLDSDMEELGKKEDEGNVSSMLDGIAGIATYPFKAFFYGCANLLRAAIAGITKLGGGNAVWSIESILFTGADGFDGIEITSINFFDMSSNSTIGKFRENVAIWYYGLRNLAIVILLGILVYVGIRMAIATVATDEAKYKKMLTDWVVSLALVFLLHYIMIFTIELNNALVTVIHTGANEGSILQSAMDEIGKRIWDNAYFTVGWSALIVYVMLIGVTMIYLFTYIKRMLTIGFLIMISPLITITYSIDKMGDGKSQALNAWLKEFMFNVLIQPFHCIIYVVFVNVAIDLLKTPSLSAAILAVVMIIFMHQAEEIVRNIFNFNSKSLGKAIASTASHYRNRIFEKTSRQI